MCQLQTRSIYTIKGVFGWVARFDTADDPVTQAEVAARGSFTVKPDDRGVSLSNTHTAMPERPGPFPQQVVSVEIRRPEVVVVCDALRRL